MSSNARFQRPTKEQRPSIASVLNTLREATYLYNLRHSSRSDCALQHDEQARAICKELLTELYSEPYLRIRTLQLLFNMVSDWTKKEMLFVEANSYYKDLRAMLARGEDLKTDAILDSMVEDLKRMNRIQEENDPNREADEGNSVDGGMEMLGISDVGSSRRPDAGGQRAADMELDEETCATMVRVYEETRLRLLEKGLVGSNEYLVLKFC
jgi:hypothetical protein